MLAKVQAASYEPDPQMMEFVRSVGKGLFGDNCAACHGRGGQGVVGMYQTSPMMTGCGVAAWTNPQRPWSMAARASYSRGIKRAAG